MEKMKVIVTGVAGFIGSHFAKKLVTEGHEVVGVDKFSSYYSPNLKRRRIDEFHSDLVELHEIDLKHPGDISRLIREFEPDSIFHFAAQPGIRLPVSENTQYIDDNIISFSNVLNSATQYEIPNLVFASSSSVYGNSQSSEFTETINLSPISFYGASKLVNERMVESRLSNSKTRVRGLRFFTVYGPWGRPDMAYFRLIANALEGTPFNLMGDGNALRDFTYIDDVVSISLSLAEELSNRPPGYFDFVNVGGGSPKSVNQMISEIMKITGSEIKLTTSEKHLGDVTYTCASAQRQLQLIGEKPTTNLSQGLAHTIEWMETPVIRERLSTWISSVKY